MKKEYCKVTGLIIFVAVLLCTVVYAEECSKKDTLPSAAQAVVEKMYPNREMAKIEAEEESLKLYEVDFADGGSMMISAEGTVVSIETKESLQSIPSVVAESIKQAAKGADIKKIEKEVVYAEIKLAELETQETIYEAKINKDGGEIEIKVDASGVILGIEKEDDDGDDEGEEDEDEIEVSIDQVPSAVKATILREAQGNPIEEIEQENEDGQTIYEAEITVDGQEVEIKVSQDGILISREIEDEEDDDDDDDD